MNPVRNRPAESIASSASERSVSYGMRIVIDARMLGWSGIGRYTAKLLDELQRLDTTNQYIVLLAKADFESWRPTSPHFQKVLADWRPFSFGEQLGLCRLLYKLRVDIVHFTNFNAPVMYLRPRLATIHDLNMLRFYNLRGNTLKRFYSRLKRLPGRFAFRCMVMRSKAVIVPSNFVKEDIEDYFRHSVFRSRLRHKIHVTHEAADKLEAPAKAVKHLATKQFLLYVGTAYPNKNLRSLVAAFERIATKLPDLYLVLAGKPDDFYKQLATEVKDRGTKQVLIPGYASEQQLVWLYQNALAFVTPSLAEGFGLPGLEAMRYGLPVVAARASCLPEIYGQAAVYFDPHDPEDIANVITTTLTNQKLLAKLRQDGPKQAARYSWPRLATQTLSIYKAAASRHKETKQ